MEWKSKKRYRAPKGEFYNRDGRWVRDFAARMEVWPAIEHWASEFDYHLVAARPTRRVYIKYSLFDKVSTIVDIKANERHLTITAGIRVELLLRFLTLFLYPKELPIAPKGWIGVRLRRAACNQLNVLLTRFNKNPIVGSEGFHIADLDLTTLVLGAVLVLPFVAFFAYNVGRFQLVPALSPVLLIEMGKYLSILSATAAGLLGLHHWVGVRKLPSTMLKWASASGCFLVFAILATILTTKTGRAMTESKFVFHCVYRFSEDACKGVVSKLSPDERARLSSHLNFLEKSLSIKK